VRSEDKLVIERALAAVTEHVWLSRQASRSATEPALRAHASIVYEPAAGICVKVFDALQSRARP